MLYIWTNCAHLFPILYLIWRRCDQQEHERAIAAWQWDFIKRKANKPKSLINHCKKTVLKLLKRHWGIRKPISPPRNPSSGWISIKKSKSRFHGFTFYRSIGKSEKGFAKLYSWTVVFFLLSMCAHARPLFLRTVFQILFLISQSNGKNENPKTDISALKSVFGFCVWLQIRNLDFKI